MMTLIIYRFGLVSLDLCYLEVSKTWLVIFIYSYLMTDFRPRYWVLKFKLCYAML
jgi:hypothetical protein